VGCPSRVLLKIHGFVLLYGASVGRIYSPGHRRVYFPNTAERPGTNRKLPGESPVDEKGNIFAKCILLCHRPRYLACLRAIIVIHKTTRIRPSTPFLCPEYKLARRASRHDSKAVAFDYLSWG
jgi:hypothetical protein